MNLHDAFVILLEATVEQNDDPQIRKARKRIAQKVESLRQKKARAVARNEGQEIPVMVPMWIEPFPPSN